MSEPIVWFSMLVIAATVAMVVTVVLWVHVLRRSPEPWPKRLAMAFLLPWGAIETWRREHRALPVVWALSIVLYVAIRATTAAIY